MGLALTAGFATWATTPTTLVIPNTNQSAPGNGQNNLIAFAGSVEYQEILGNGQFPGNPIVITGLSFRAAPGTGPTKVTIGSLSVFLSTSPNYPNTSGSGKTLMSSTFASNIGPDKTLVYTGTNVTLSDSGCTSVPCPFDLTITFTTPFTFNSTGPLLIDMLETNVTANGGNAFDAESSSAPGGSVAQVLGPLGAATGTFSYQGNIVQLTYTAVAGFPTISGVVNAGSELPTGLPNSGIAQGALFDVYGTNLSATPPNGSAFTEASLPLPNTLAGAAISINVGGTVVNAPILFALPTQIGAVMPSNTPLGSGSLTVSYNGKSISSQINVVQNAFGISYIYIQNANNGVGMGEQAAVTFVTKPTQAAINTYTAAPGDQMVLWGTGLGATTVAGDSAGAPFGDIGPAPSIYVGGVLSPNVAYWGRSPGSVALDQINFTIPANAPLGCNVSVIVETMNGSTPVVSNGPTISIAATDGATCSDPTEAFPYSITSKTSAKVMYINVSQTAQVSGSNQTTTSSSATGLFFSVNQSQLAAFAASSLQSIDYQPSYGSCYVGFNSNPTANGGLSGVTILNAGAALTLTPPSGPAVVLASQTGGTYGSATGTTALPSGSWMFSNGTGGSGVGPLNFTFNMPQQIVWTNRSSVANSTITRASPLTITWTGGDANGYVDIQGSTQSGIYYVGFECTAPTSAGQFTIPASAMLGLPANGGGIQVSTYAIPASLGTVTGFDLALNASQFQTNAPVTFK